MLTQVELSGGIVSRPRTEARRRPATSRYGSQQQKPQSDKRPFAPRALTRRDCNRCSSAYLRATKRVYVCILDKIWTGNWPSVVKSLIFLASPTGFEPVLPP